MSAALEDLFERKYLRTLLAGDDDWQADAVVLVGSRARDGYRLTPLSDIDVLVVADSAPRAGPPGVQVIRLPKDEVRRRAKAGNDFVQWALRFGVPLSGRKLWHSLRDELLPDAPWPDPDLKREHARARLRAAQSLLGMGDLDAAQEEARYAVSHLARSELLARQVFPLSRPELPDQLRGVGLSDPADLLEEIHSLELLPSQELEEILTSVATALGRGGSGT